MGPDSGNKGVELSSGCPRSPHGCLAEVPTQLHHHRARVASGFAAAAGAPVTVAAPTALKKTSPWAGVSEPDEGIPVSPALKPGPGQRVAVWCMEWHSGLRPATKGPPPLSLVGRVLGRLIPIQAAEQLPLR